MQITSRKRKQLLVSNVLSVALVGFIVWINHDYICLAVLLPLFVLINAVRIYSWSKMQEAAAESPTPRT